MAQRGDTVSSLHFNQKAVIQKGAVLALWCHTPTREEAQQRSPAEEGATVTGRQGGRQDILAADGQCK